MKTEKLTTAQALVRFLKNQYVRRDGKEVQFIKGVWGIFGHGNVAGIGQALQEYPELPYYLARNEQAMTHSAVAYSKSKNRMEAFACTASVGPGSTKGSPFCRASDLRRSSATSTCIWISSLMLHLCSV